MRYTQNIAILYGFFLNIIDIMRITKGFIALTVAAFLISSCAGLDTPLETQAEYNTRQCKELSNIGGASFALRKDGASFSEVIPHIHSQDSRFYVGLAYDLPINYTKEKAIEELFRVCMMSAPAKNHRYDFKSSY